MTELNTYLENIGAWKKTSWSLMMVALMVFSTTIAFMGTNTEFQQDWADSIQRTSVQTADQDDQPFRDRETTTVNQRLGVTPRFLTLSTTIWVSCMAK